MTGERGPSIRWNTLLNGGITIDHPSGTAVVESWEEVEEVIHKRWKHKHWLSLPGESHLPEQ